MRADTSVKLRIIINLLDELKMTENLKIGISTKKEIILIIKIKSLYQIYMHLNNFIINDSEKFSPWKLIQPVN